MPKTFHSSQEWLDQTRLLIQAQPTTTRITTKYAIKPPKPRTTKRKTPETATTTSSSTTAAPTTAPPAPDDAPKKPPRGLIVLKAYNPTSGVVLKYRTTKAAEVARLIGALGQASRTMAGLPDEQPADVPMPDAVAEEGVKDGVVAGPSAGAGAAAATQQSQQPAQGGGGGGGGKKRKKGKK